MRRRIAAAATLALVLAGCGGSDGSDNGAGADGSDVACDATAPPSPKELSYDAPPPTAESRAYTAVLTTSCGPVTLTLAGDKAPQTVGSFVFLATNGYFDGTRCHRLTRSPSLTVLQCGDPTGSGRGGPGYQFPDENLAGATYPRGTVAMANAGPGTNGSQFFLVIADSQLPPAYTPFGTIDEAGLTSLDKVLAAGTADGGADGAPVKPVYLEKVTVT